MSLNDFSGALHIDLAATLAHFDHNEEMYVRFLKKAANDPTFSNLCHACTLSDFSQIEMYAHTLKGLAATLGLSELSLASDTMMDAIHQRKPDKALRQLPRIKDCYRSYIKALPLLEN